VLRPAAAQQLLRACIAYDTDDVRMPRTRMGPLILLALTVGLRSDELRGLRWSEVFTDEAEIRLPRERTKGKLKGRTIHLTVSPVAVELLEALRARSFKKGDIVFVPELGDGGADGYLSRNATTIKIQKLVKDYGAPVFTLKTCRATCGSTLVNCKGLPLTFKQAATQLGHTVVVAERSYWNESLQLSSTARSIEEALGITELAEQIVANVRSAAARKLRHPGGRRQQASGDGAVTAVAE
jgi:integrase